MILLIGWFQEGVQVEVLLQWQPVHVLPLWPLTLVALSVSLQLTVE